MQILTRKTGAFAALMLCTMFSTLAGCVAFQPKNIGEIKETRALIYKGYEGREQPEERLAWVDWGFVSELALFKMAYGYVVFIDDSKINRTNKEMRALFPIERRKEEFYSAAELLPGEHSFDFDCTAARGSTHTFRLHANVEAGHIYRIHCDAYKYAESPLLFATEMIDLTTGKLVAGRPLGSLDWSWSDFKQVLHDLKNSHANRQIITEMFLRPYWSNSPSIISAHFDEVARGLLDSDRIMVYKVRPGMSGVLAGDTGILNGYNYKPLPFLMGELGLLFLEFDQSERLANYYYFGIPDRNCLKLIMPPAWHASSELIEDQACSYFAQALTIAKYLVATGRFRDSYIAIERAIFISTILTNNQLELSPDFFNVSNHPEKEANSKEIQSARQKALMQFFQEAKVFFSQNPAVLVAAKKLFTEEAIKSLKQDLTGTSMEMTQKRLIIYKEFASSQDFAEAKESSERLMLEHSN